MNKKIVLTAFVLAVSLSARAQDIADWTFETSQPATAGPYSPEVGAGSATGSHSSSSAVYSTPAGNMSTHSYSANFWTINDYWQYQVSTTGDTGINLSWDQTGSSTGPKTFQLEYSVDGVTYFNVGSTYSVLLSTWSPTAGGPAFTTTVNLSTATSDAVDNQATLFLRFVDESAATGGSIGNGNVGTTGTDRMDNVIVSTVPEPSVMALIGMGGTACVGFFRRFRK